jgi:predicted O-linked N-acetylglucosamine transferase (SPINDLY family)
MHKWIKRLLSPASSQDSAKTEHDHDFAAADTSRLQGDAWMSKGDARAAEQAYRQALAIDNSNAMILCGLAHAQAMQGLSDEAQATAMQSLAIDEKNIDVHRLLASLAQSRGDIENAISYYNAALAISPDCEPVYLELGFLLFQLGRLDDAVQLLHSGLKHCGNTADLHFYLGNIFHARGEYASAIASFQQATIKQPQRPEFHANLGLTLLNNGELEHAAQELRTTIELAPHMIEAHVNLGSALLQLGDIDAAVVAYQNGLAIDASSVVLLNNLALALNTQKNWEAAAQASKAALALAPGNAESHFNLGNALQGQKNFKEAIASYRQALQHDGSNINYLNNLGGALRTAGEYEEALACYQRILEMPSDLERVRADALNNAALTLISMGRHEEATEKLQQAISLVPGFVDAHFHLGGVLYERKKYVEALLALQTALEIEPTHTAAAIKLASAYRAAERLDDALATIRQAIAKAPDQAEAHGVQGDILQTMGMLPQAEASFREALRLDNKMVMAYCNLGIALHKMHRNDEAIACFQRALDIDPDNVSVLSHLAHACKDKKQFEQAIAYVKCALKIQPGFEGGYALLADIQLAYGKLEQARDSYRQELELYPESLDTHSAYLFMLNFLSDMPASTALEEAKTYGRLASQHARKFKHWLCSFDPKRPLRIGLVSGDFRDHPVGYFLENVLRALVDHAQPKLQIFGYYSHFTNDGITADIRSCCDTWRDVYSLSDEQLANQVHQDAIDILIDISGHTAHNRLPMFAWKPAPVQATWLGYFPTTGLAEIDYRIADPWVPPIANEINFTEKVFRLHETYVCFTPPHADIVVTPLPALENGYVTFGSFNNLTKLNDPVIATWARILKSVDKSRLFLKTHQLSSDIARQAIVDRFAAHDIAPDRLILEGFSARSEHLKAYQRMDISLDPFPVPGGTTSVEALWMGIPIVSLAGEHYLSHIGASTLHNAGLHDWIATSIDEYIDHAVSFAKDVNQLASLRSDLRSRVLNSPLFDAPRFARNFNVALHEMWSTRCAEDIDQSILRT